MKLKINHTLLFIVSALFYYAVLVFTQNRWIVAAQLFFFLLPALFVIIASQRAELFRTRVTGPVWLRVVLISIAATLVLNGLSFYWEQWVPTTPVYEEQVSGMLHVGQRFGLILDLITRALVPAFAEEFFFRGYLQSILLKKARPFIAVLIAGFVFAASHFNLQLFPFYFILGIIFGVIVLKTGNIWPAVVAHAINNTIAIIFLYVLRA